jgi:Tol biopolymer transport system component
MAIPRRLQLCLAGAAALLVGGLAPPLAGATFAGDNGRISFNAFSEVTGGVEIFTARPNGSDVQLLTDSGVDGASQISDWSPDGQTIAFDSDRVDDEGLEDVVQIYLMNADGSEVTQLTRGPGFHGNPGFSPDGGQLAIDADWGDFPANQGIWLIPAEDADGVTQEDAERVTSVPEDADFDSEPQFSPNGRSIVFTRFRDPTHSAIYRVRADGSGLRRLTSFRLNASDPDWSPNGRKITFDSGDALQAGSRSNVFVMRANGKGRKRLTDVPRIGEDGPFVGAQNPVWSPNGKRIMFTRFLAERSVLKVMRRDGSRKRVAVEQSGFPNKVDGGTGPGPPACRAKPPGVPPGGSRPLFLGVIGGSLG